MKKYLVMMLAALSLSAHAFADVRDEAPLDPVVPQANPVLEQEESIGNFFLDAMNLLPPARNDLGKALTVHTPVKSQIARGTCSIFSTLAMVESLLKIKHA